MRSRERGSRTETGGKMSTFVERTLPQGATALAVWDYARLGAQRAAGVDVSWNVPAALKRSMKRNVTPDETRREPQGRVSRVCVVRPVRGRTRRLCRPISA